MFRRHSLSRLAYRRTPFKPQFFIDTFITDIANWALWVGDLGYRTTHSPGEILVVLISVNPHILKLNINIIHESTVRVGEQVYKFKNYNLQFTVTKVEGRCL
jgi:hypothetical protein